MRVMLSAVFKGTPDTAVMAMRTRALLEGEAGVMFRLPRGSRSVRVASGTLWVSVDGQDVVLRQNETMALPERSRDAVLLSALAGAPAVVVWEGEGDLCANGIRKTSFWRRWRGTSAGRQKPAVSNCA